MFKGGLVLDGVTVPCAGFPKFSFPSSLIAFGLDLERRCCKDSLRGLVLAGILEIRKGIEGGPAFSLLDARYVCICERLGERYLSVGFDGLEVDIDADAECEIGFTDDCDLLRSANDVANSAEGTVGEKFARVVGFGASRDMGGFVLGFRIGGDSGSGISDEKFGLLIGDVIVEGGEIGMDPCEWMALRGLMGFDRSGFG